MTNLEMLRTATSEQVQDMFCDDCEKCPSFIFERCHVGKNGFFEWLNEEAETQKDAPEDVSTGWVKLKAPNGTIYIKTSEIVGLAPIPPDAPFAMDGIITKVFTRYDESAAWLVCDTVDEIIEKIKKA